MAEVYEEMLYMRTREEEMRNTNGEGCCCASTALTRVLTPRVSPGRVCAWAERAESTNSRVMWYSVFTIVVLMGLGAAQVWILRRDFKAKRLIY